MPVFLACGFGWLADWVSGLWLTLAVGHFRSANAFASTRVLVRCFCGNGEWSRRPDTQSTSQGSAVGKPTKDKVQGKTQNPKGGTPNASCVLLIGAADFTACRQCLVFGSHMACQKHSRRRMVGFAGAGRTCGCHRRGAPTKVLTQQHRNTSNSRPRREPENADHASRLARGVALLPKRERLQPPCAKCSPATARNPKLDFSRTPRGQRATRSERGGAIHPLYSPICCNKYSRW